LSASLLHPCAMCKVCLSSGPTKGCGSAQLLLRTSWVLSSASLQSGIVRARSHVAPLVDTMRCAVQASVTAAMMRDGAAWGEWHACDAAIACEVVEHVYDPDAFAQALLGALRCVGGAAATGGFPWLPAQRAACMQATSRVCEHTQCRVQRGDSLLHGGCWRGLNAAPWQRRLSNAGSRPQV
jgi:hypothetical protein